MLLQFLCSNFASIRDEVILSLVPSHDNSHPGHIVHNGEYSALKEIAIYGPNASGKSSLFRAITSAVNIIRQSSNRQVDDFLHVVPFKFDRISPLKPSKFEFTFVASDNRKYIYGFSADSKRVHEEYLYCCTSSEEPSIIFDRTEDEYEYAPELKKQFETVQKLNTPNKLLLATATSWNVQLTSVPYKWFAEEIDTFTNDLSVGSRTYRLYSYSDKKYTDFIIDLLKRADINIHDIKIDFPNITDTEGGQVPPEALRRYWKFRTGHTVRDGNESEKTYQLSLEEESLGTRVLFYFAPIIKDALDSGKTLVIDEFERSMHPSIVKFLVNMFHSPKKNPHSAQLIFITHETTLLSVSTFRRDQIYFTQKDPATAVTELYSLGDIRGGSSNDDIEKKYLLGRYGAVPFMQPDDLEDPDL